MEGFNQAVLIGNLGADPELRFTQGGQAVLNMRLATTESYLDKDKVRRERVDWHNVVVWGKRGEGLVKILKKGSRITVIGPVRTSSYDDKDGNKRYKTEIDAQKVILGDGPRDKPGDDRGGYSGNGPPNQGGSPSRNQSRGRDAPPADPGPPDGFGYPDDDIAF